MFVTDLLARGSSRKLHRPVHIRKTSRSTEPASPSGLGTPAPAPESFMDIWVSTAISSQHP